MLSEPPGADPHAGWCGRGQGEPGLYPILRGPRRGNAPGLPAEKEVLVEGRAAGSGDGTVQELLSFRTGWSSGEGAT